MEDFLDLIDTLLAADTYDNVGRPIVRGAELVKNAGAGAFAKGSGAVTWGFRGLDALVDEVGIDLPPGVRAQLRAEAEQAKAGFFTNEVLPPEPGAVDVVNVGASASDSGARPPSGDSVVTGTFDP